MFRITQSKGFQVTFENGYTLSVQFGFCNYSQHRFNKDAVVDGDCSSNTAEIAVITPKCELMRLTLDDCVRGYIKADEVAEIMAIVATRPESLTPTPHGASHDIRM